MKTSVNFKKMNRTSAISMFLLFAISTPAFSQNNNTSFFSSIDGTMILSIVGVFVLAAFMFISMIRSKNKEHREIDQEQRQIDHEHRRHRMHLHRRHAHAHH